MNVLDQKILEMKRKGMSLRGIAKVVGLTHEGVRKKLAALLRENRVSTNLENQFTPTTIEKEKVSTCSKPHESRACAELRYGVNSLSTKKPPYPTLIQDVNPLGSASRRPDKPPGSLKGVFKGVILDDGDLFEAIREFLESEGIEVYRMQNGGYQVKGNREIVRFYISRRDRQAAEE